MSKIQFYLSEDLVLSRERNRGRTSITQGRVRMVNGKEVEEIVFKRGTPGVLLFAPKENNLAIGFDPKDDDKFLVFGENPKRSGRYTLLAKDWNRYRGKVSYAGQQWNVSVSNADVNLLISLKKSGNTKYKVQQPTGRRL